MLNIQYESSFSYPRNVEGNQDDLIELDGVGGVSIFGQSQVFRSGVNFPASYIWNHAETEAFGKMAKKSGFSWWITLTTFYGIFMKPSEDTI